MEKQKNENKVSILKNIMIAVKSLGTDYSSEDKEIQKEVEKLEKIQKQVHDEQEEFEKSLKVDKTKLKTKQKTKAKAEKVKLEEREIGE